MKKRFLIFFGAVGGIFLTWYLLTCAKGPGICLFSQPGAAKLYKAASRAQEAGNIDEAISTYNALLTQFPDYARTKEVLAALGELYEKKGMLLEAKETYERFSTGFPDSVKALAIEPKLWDLNMKLFLSPILTAKDKTYEVNPGDTLSSIARAHSTTVECLMKQNNLTGFIIHPRQKLKVPQERFNVAISKSQNTLTLQLGNEVFKVYKVSTGANNSTPTGRSTITNKLKDPVWYAAKAIVPAGSPDNILGSRWLGLSVTGYGIHGTTDPESIGGQFTQGCVRMNNSDVEELYSILPIGTEVVISD